MVVIGLLGATLLYGDGAITPAISVLSAIEGLKIYAPQTEHVIVPLTVAILVLLAGCRSASPGSEVRCPRSRLTISAKADFC